MPISKVQPASTTHEGIVYTRIKGGSYRTWPVDDGHVYRLRRGKIVKVPDKWEGKVTGRQTIARRKDAARLKRYMRRLRKRHGHTGWPHGL